MVFVSSSENFVWCIKDMTLRARLRRFIVSVPSPRNDETERLYELLDVYSKLNFRTLRTD